MKDEEYVGTYTVNGTEVKLGMDDYGQCYFIEYVNPKTNELEEMSLGAYNLNYMEEMYGLFDNNYYELYMKKRFHPEEFTESDSDALNAYQKIFDDEYRKYDKDYKSK